MDEIIYRTTYEGESYPPDGEPGPTTTDPRKLAEETLRPGQRMIATDPNGNAKVFTWFKGRLISTQWGDTMSFPIKF